MPRRREKYFNRTPPVLTSRDGAWCAAVEIGYPFGKLYQLLLLTALRSRKCSMG